MTTAGYRSAMANTPSPVPDRIPDDKVQQEREVMAEKLRQRIKQERDVANAEYDARQAAKR